MDISVLLQGHPFLANGVSFMAGAAIKHWLPMISTKGAKWFVQKSFAIQRSRLKGLGTPDDQINEILKEEAAFLVNAGEEAQAEIDQPAAPPPQPASK